MFDENRADLNLGPECCCSRIGQLHREALKLLQCKAELGAATVPMKW